MGCIDSDKSNPVYLVGSYCKKSVRIIRNKWGRCEIWIHIRTEIIVIVEFHFTNKKEKQTTNKKKTKNLNQAYIKVDLDLDDS